MTGDEVGGTKTAPGQGCSCALCKEPHTIELQAVEPGTPEHEAWVLEQGKKRGLSENKFYARGDEIGRPKFWMRG